MIEKLSEVALSLAAPFVLGVFGFLWRVNSKISSIEAQLKAHDGRITSNSHKLNTHFEKAFTIRKDKD